MIAAFASIDLSKRVRLTKGKSRQVWLFAGGSVLGTGIWSMHFIGMLAFHLPLAIYYDPLLVFLSIFGAIFGCISGFYVVATPSFKSIRLPAGSVLMGAGIVTMHYIGMEAVQPMDISYEPFMVGVSVLIAAAASTAALWLGFYSPYARKEMTWKIKSLFAAIMAVAITGMHYTGMAATHFHTPSAAVSDGMMDISLMTWSVFVITLFLFLLTYSFIAIDRFIRKQVILQTLMFDSADDCIIITEKEGIVLHANAAFTNLFPQSGEPFPFEQISSDLEPNKRQTMEIKRNEETLIVEVTKHLISGEGMDHSLWFIRDITEKKRSEQFVEFMAFHDPLTGLPNRHKMEIHLNEWIETQEKVSCIFLDLDRLKFTNDTLGHDAGDQLLQEVASRLMQIIPPQSLLTRQGGDEFIIISNETDSLNVVHIADECVKAMNVPFSIKGMNIRVTVSAGISRYPSEASSAAELIRFADLAMYESKKKGKNCVTEFNQGTKEIIKRKLLIEEALVKAIDKKEFHLLYQPKVNMQTYMLEGVEALTRWHHPVLGAISPTEFIPIVEEKGMIDAMGEWVLTESCKQWVDWIREGTKPIMMGVNISPFQFSREDFIPRLKEILSKTGMDPNFLELEITESSAMAYESHAKKTLNELRSMGIKISLDDFGTGYSSFKHLKELPIEILKIDRSFLENFSYNEDQEAIVRSMIQLGHNLNMRVLVEGVEDAHQMEWLKKEGCDMMRALKKSKNTRKSNGVNGFPFTPLLFSFLSVLSSMYNEEDYIEVVRP